MRFLRSLHVKRWVGLAAIYLFVLQTLLAAALAGQAVARPMADDIVLCSGQTISGDSGSSSDQPSQHPNSCCAFCTATPALAVPPVERLSETIIRIEAPVVLAPRERRTVVDLLWVRSGASRAPPVVS